MSKIFVGNLSWKTSEDELKQVFEQFGTVVSVKIVLDIEGKSKGFGFVEMDSNESAKAAIEKTDNLEIGGRNLRVSAAKSREELSDRPRREFRSDRNQGSGGFNSRPSYRGNSR